MSVNKKYIFNVFDISAYTPLVQSVLRDIKYYLNK